MLKIRLQRVGKKHDPSFRIVLVDSRRGPKSGNFIEILGFYNARKGEPQFRDAEKIKDYIANGAQLSGTISNLLVRAGVLEKEIVNVLPKLSKKKKAKAEAEKVKEESKAPAEKEKEAPTEKIKAKEEAPSEVPAKEIKLKEEENADKVQAKETKPESEDKKEE